MRLETAQGCQRSGQEGLLACRLRCGGEITDIQQAVELSLECVAHVPDLGPDGRPLSQAVSSVHLSHLAPDPDLPDSSTSWIDEC